MLELTKRSDGWWITNCPDGVDEMGPYTTKDEANDDLRGVHRTLKANKKLYPDYA